MKKNFELIIIKKETFTSQDKGASAYNKGDRIMDYKRQQDRFDDIKWYDSILAGDDRCGTYEFCGKCRKTETYPCARAMHRYEKGCVRIAVVRRRV